MISRSSRKQGSIAQSTAEAEYIVASVASREAVWLRKLLSDLFSAELEPTVIHYDNKSCVNFKALRDSCVFHYRTKRIEMRYHYVRDIVQNNIISIQYVSTAEQIADIFDQASVVDKVCVFRDKLGVAEREC
jgi:hypothetical protein